MKKYKKVDRKLKIIEIENGIILPRKMIEDDYPMWGLGGVCDSNNQFCQESFYEGDWATHGGKYAWEEEEHLDEEAVYIGMFFSHWGHFLVDLSNRFWALPKIVAENPNVKIAYLGEETPAGNNLRLFELLGVRKEQLYQIKKPIRFKKVFIPEQSFKPNTWYSDEFILMFNELYNKIINSTYDFSRVKDLDKVYFTRRSYGKAVSSEFGEEFFESFFKYNGYKIVAPEKLELEEQIYIWNKAKSITCINGAITQNIMFSCNKNLNWIVLNKTSIYHENPVFFQYTRGINGSFVNVFEEPLKNYPKSLGEGPFLLKYTAEFKQLCSEKGLKNFQSDKKTDKYFRSIKINYYLSVLAITKRMKNFIRKYILKR